MLQDTTLQGGAGLQGWSAGVVMVTPSRCWALSPVLSVEVWERRGQPLQQPGLSRITQPPWQGGSSELQPGQPTQ